MTIRVNVVIADDIDGSPGAKPVLFSLKDEGYQIDLSPANKERFRVSLQPFIDAARLNGQRKRTHTAPRRDDGPAIRAWAARQGMQVAERGRIRVSVIRKYYAAHPCTDKITLSTRPSEPARSG